MRGIGLIRLTILIIGEPIKPTGFISHGVSYEHIYLNLSTNIKLNIKLNININRNLNY